MMIGPDRKQGKRDKKRDRPKKAKKRAKADAASPVVEPTPIVEPTPFAGTAAATGNPGSVTPAAASATTDDLPTLGDLPMLGTPEPEPERNVDPIAALLAGIDHARDRLDGLLDLAQTLTGAPPVGRGLGLQLVPDLSPEDEPTVAEPPAATSVPPTGPAVAALAVPVAVSAPDVAPPTASARLVARELLERGMDAEGVRTRLRDGYGVPDPDAVLAALA